MNPAASLIPLKSRIASIFLLILFSSLVYFNSLQGAFQFDDRNLLTREWVRDLDRFQQNVRLSSFENRPVLLWTFAANNQLDSKHTFGFHLANLILHVLVSVLIFLILLGVQFFPDNGTGPRAARSLIFPFAAALLFAVHPLNTDSVAYISSRSSLLATFFYLLTLYVFMAMLAPGRSLRQRVLLGLLTIPGMYLALASKLIAVTLPVILLLWFLVFFCPRYFPNLAARVFGAKMLAVYAGAGVALLAAAHFYDDLLYSPKDQGLELFGRIPYFLVQTKVIVFYYLKQFFLPFNLNVDSGFPFSTFLMDAKIAVSILLLAVIVLWILKRGNVWIKLGAAWFFLTLAPTSSLVPLNDLAVEHRMYLPMSLGLCLAAGWVIGKLRRTQQLHALALILIVCGLLTITRNAAWVSEVALWSDAALKNPHSSRVHNNLGKAYYEAGKLDVARVHLEKSVAGIPKYALAQYNIASPELFLKRRQEANAGNRDLKAKTSATDRFQLKADFAEPHYNLASVYLDLGQLDAAETQYRAALALKPEYFAAELGLGSLQNQKGNYDLAIEHFLRSIESMRRVTGQDEYALARLNLGEVYGKTQRYREAIAELTQAVQADPSMTAAHFNLGTAYMFTGALDAAEHSFKTCLKLNGSYEPALFNLARVYQNKNQWEASTLMFQRFLEVKGPAPAVYSAMAWNHLQSGKTEQAKSLYEKTLALEPNHPEALVNLAKIHYRLGQNDTSRAYLERALKLNLPEAQASELSQMLKELSTL
ncbi:MAG: tetratricopeptide repeat protein [Nitrospinae bacterium]|nr:tetratricopeptide repeat protein [Nitrospinota bacterium]